ncbi:hypothetical protein CUMW_170820, partial [Citrus unshiu]
PLKPNHQRTSQNKSFAVVLLPSPAPPVLVASTPSNSSIDKKEESLGSHTKCGYDVTNDIGCVYCNLTT